MTERKDTNDETEPDVGRPHRDFTHRFLGSEWREVEPGIFMPSTTDTPPTTDMRSADQKRRPVLRKPH